MKSGRCGIKRNVSSGRGCGKCGCREAVISVCAAIVVTGSWTGRALWNESERYKEEMLILIEQVSSMIHSARPTVPPVANIAFTWNLFCFEKWGRMDLQQTYNMCENNDHNRPWLWSGLVDQQNSKDWDKKCVINDPHSPSSSDHYLYFKIVLFCLVLKCGDGRMTCEKTMITTGRNCGSPEWINSRLVNWFWSLLPSWALISVI